MCMDDFTLIDLHLPMIYLVFTDYLPTNLLYIYYLPIIYQFNMDDFPWPCKLGLGGRTSSTRDVSTAGGPERIHWELFGYD